MHLVLRVGLGLSRSCVILASNLLGPRTLHFSGQGVKCGRKGVHSSVFMQQPSRKKYCSAVSAQVLSSDQVAMAQGVIETGYGSWRSPITADLVGGATKKFGGCASDSEGRLLWVEGRPTEAGRYVLMREGSNPGAASEDITPAGFSVRTVVHEYGGGAFAVDGDLAVFSNYADQCLYKQSLKGDMTPVRLTPDYGKKAARYADGIIDKRFDRYITVREDERVFGKEAVNEIVAVQLNEDGNSEPVVLVSGNDFYSFPRLSPDGKKLAWMEWSHPNLPWDRTSIWIGDITIDGDVVNRTCVAGGNEEIVEAPTEPRWSPEGELFFVSDRNSGYWNIYRWVSEKNKVQPVYPLEAEFTRPSWNFGNTNFDFVRSKETSLRNHIVCTYRQRGHSYMGLIDLATGFFTSVDNPFCDIFGLMPAGEHVYIYAGSTHCPPSIIKVNLLKNGDGKHETTVQWSSFNIDIEKYRAYLSVPEIVEFQTKVEGETAFANFYPPTNDDFKPLSGEKPPLLVRSHGGPTGEATATLDFNIQYWTSRGWAFADVNYSGSTGYGRQYRERLNGQWGVRDVQDCCSCAEYLSAEGKVDGKRLCIEGRSAGGYTTIAAMVFANTFAAGCSKYGLSELTIFMAETHKFESRYLDSLIGTETEALYNRSPINFIQNWSCPIILFQGLDDKIVPPNQARMIYDAVKAKGLPVALVEYEGEGHGFLKGENIKNTLEQEMTFFARLIGGFEMADEVTPIHIDNYDEK